jgi:O-antigen/teichoic acid export membrane protein
VLDNRSVGIYTAAYQLGFTPLLLLATSASVFVSPVLFRRAGDGSDPLRVQIALKLNRQLFCICVAGSGLAAISTYMLRRQLVRLMLGHGYGEVAQYLPWLVIASGLFACGQIASEALRDHRETKALIAPKIGTGILAIVLYILGARIAGIYGVVAANIAWTFAYCIWILVLADRRKRSILMGTLIRSD